MPRVQPNELKIYRGLWIALVRGRVVASGSRAQETLLHCRAMRLKDEPVLRFVPHRVKKSGSSIKTNVKAA
jgi:hypothetical protein